MLCTLLSACEGEHPVECLCTLFPFVQGFCPTGFTLTKNSITTWSVHGAPKGASSPPIHPKCPPCVLQIEEHAYGMKLQKL
ncbi:hypothetical protein LXL04_026253 [Taraxacum kok-saghyz]